MLKKISKDDWQYLIPSLACTICFVASDFLGIIEKTSIAYWSGRLFLEPYRILTSHFFHGDINHFLANISGIIVARYFLKALNLRDNNFFLVLTCFLIPIQSIIFFLFDILVFRNSMSLAIGFSGILFGVDAFILLTTIFGKRRFLFFDCGLVRNQKLLRSILVMTMIGIIWSFLPGISLLGHLSGFLAGGLLFLL